MPFLSVTTNVRVDAAKTEVLLTELTNLIVDKLNKPKDYVQVAVCGDQTMQFAGTSEPTAFLELRALGLDEEAAKSMTTALTKSIQSGLKISPNRMFLNLLDVPRAR